jgi:Ser/Thr protein kinase RdoA (MazF antagonist)
MSDRAPGGAARPERRLLRDNPDHVHQLCDRFALGTPGGDLSKVSGGYHHRMWRLDTQGGRFAVKQVAEDMDVSDHVTADRLNATEAAGRAFADRGIPALASLSHDGRHLQVIDGEGYFVFPWTDSRARGKNDIEAYHANTVAAILARMHHADIQVPDLAEQPTWPLTEQRVRELLQLARQRNARDAEYLIERQADILAVVDVQDGAWRALSRHEVVSHGDLDHKNVLWDEDGAPLLIDWESTRPLNPTYELLLEALDWSGISANFETGPFEGFLGAYIDAGGRMIGDMVAPAFDAILGAWVNWMLFNVGRTLGRNDPRQRALGSEQVDLAVGALLRLEKNIPRLKDIAGRYAT